MSIIVDLVILAIIILCIIIGYVRGLTGSLIKIVSFKFPDICKEIVHGVPILLPNLQFCVFDKNSIKNMREVSYDAI